MRSPIRYPQKAFTILELIVVITILLVIIALVIPYIRNAVEKSRSVECASRLRAIGILFFDYAAERQGTILFFRDGSPTKSMWYTELKKLVDYSEQEAQSAFGCPSMDRENVDSWRCYGFRVSGSPGKVVRNIEDWPGVYQLSIGAVQQPSSFMIMGDTSNSSGKTQTFRIIPPGLYSGGGIQMRHQDRANILFLDGHVEALDAVGLARIGMTRVLDANATPLELQLP